MSGWNSPFMDIIGRFKRLHHIRYWFDILEKDSLPRENISLKKVRGSFYHDFASLNERSDSVMSRRRMTENSLSLN